MSADTTFKNIRNRIQRHNAVELLYEFLKLMNHPDALEFDRLRHYPLWHLLLPVKWIVMYGDYRTTPSKKDVSQYYVNELVNRMHSLSKVVRKPSQYRNWLLFLRNMAFNNSGFKNLSLNNAIIVGRASRVPFLKRYADLVCASLDTSVKRKLTCIASAPPWL